VRLRLEEVDEGRPDPAGRPLRRLLHRRSGGGGGGDGRCGEGQNPSVEEGPAPETVGQRWTEWELREGGDAGERDEVVAARHAVRGREGETAAAAAAGWWGAREARPIRGIGMTRESRRD
jgi:hypothetical protein